MKFSQVLWGSLVGGKKKKSGNSSFVIHFQWNIVIKMEIRLSHSQDTILAVKDCIWDYMFSESPYEFKERGDCTGIFLLQCTTKEFFDLHWQYTFR